MRRNALLGLAWVLWLTAAGASAPEAAGQPSQEPAAVVALRDEIQRAVKLSLPGMPSPHFVSATLFDLHEAAIEASLGAVVLDDRLHSRLLKTEMIVREGGLDSSNFHGEAESAVIAEQIAVDDDPYALRRAAWLLLDRSYKNATAVFEAKRAHQQSRVDGAQQSSTLGPGSVAIRFAPSPGPVDADRFVSIARNVSQVFAAYPDVHESSVKIALQGSLRTIVTSEGSQVQEPFIMARVEITCRTQASDGMPLADFAMFSAHSADQLPTEQTMIAAAREVAERVVALRAAPVVADYSGPVLFEGLAAAQVLRVLLAEELSATPPPEPGLGDPDDRPAFEGRAQWRVMPTMFDVVDDPLRTSLDGNPLLGGFEYDDEAQRAQRVEVIVEGRLQNLLGGRISSASGMNSNGHGRAGVTSEARGRNSNLLVSARKGLSQQELRRQLRSLAGREGLAYGLLILKLDEPRVTRQALSSRARFGGLPLPLVMMRIGVDGKEELVRGGVLQALRTRDLRHVVAAGREQTVYSYLASSSPVRGGSGGDIPTSIAAPALLFPDADVRMPATAHELPPILSRPASVTERVQSH